MNKALASILTAALVLASSPANAKATDEQVKETWIAACVAVKAFPEGTCEGVYDLPVIQQQLPPFREGLDSCLVDQGFDFETCRGLVILLFVTNYNKEE